LAPALRLNTFHELYELANGVDLTTFRTAEVIQRPAVPGATSAIVLTSDAPEQQTVSRSHNQDIWFGRMEG